MNLTKKDLLEIEKLQLYHKSSFDLYVGKSSIHGAGLGIFTKSSIPKNTYIDDYYGEILERHYGGEYCFAITEKLIVDAMKSPRCYMAMLNDASFKVHKS